MNTKQIIGFHNPDEEYGYLSNWYRSDFEKDGIRFSSMEQYMMYQKARCFRDEKVAAEILKTDDVGRIKHLGHRLIDEGPRSTRREKVARNEPAGVCTHDRTRTGVKGENPDTNINTYLMIYRYE